MMMPPWVLFYLLEPMMLRRLTLTSWQTLMTPLLLFLTSPALLLLLPLLLLLMLLPLLLLLLHARAQFKTSSEVACLQHASNISSEAHLAVMQAAPRSAFEYELESEFLRATRYGGLKHMGYPAIIGAGKNSAILHYGRNDAAISSPGDVVLMDAGAEYRCYTADITR